MGMMEYKRRGRCQALLADKTTTEEDFKSFLRHDFLALKEDVIYYLHWRGNVVSRYLEPGFYIVKFEEVQDKFDGRIGLVRQDDFEANWELV